MTAWLETALDVGISELDFWEMTFAEIERATAAWQRRQRRELQEMAMFTHRLADLIGHSVSRIYSQSATLPSLYDAFPSIFETTDAEKEQRAQAAAEISALRFMQFAQAHNEKKGGAFEN